MIRFSAVLVAAAIAVLVAGIATSKLLLVYIAIAASVAALVALAIGVVLKRNELFGAGQQLAPEPARAGSGAASAAAPDTAQDRSRVPDQAHGFGQAGAGQAGSASAQPALAGLNAGWAGATPGNAARPGMSGSPGASGDQGGFGGPGGFGSPGAPGGQWREPPADQAPPWAARFEPDRSPRPAWAPPAQEPTRQEPIRQEPTRQEPVRPEPVRLETARPQPARPEPLPAREQPASGGAWRPAAAWLDTSPGQTDQAGSGRSGATAGDTPPGTSPGGRRNAWSTPDAAATGYAGTRAGPGSAPAGPASDPAPRPWGADSWAQQPPRTPDVTPAGPSVGLPSWFDRPGAPAGDAPAGGNTPVATGSAWDRPGGRHATPEPTKIDTPSATRIEPAVSATQVEPSASATRIEPAISATRSEPALFRPLAGDGDPPAETTEAADEDDDWPTRYSWLDDEEPEPNEEPTPDDTTRDPAGEAESTKPAPVADSFVAGPAADASASADPALTDPSATRPTPAALLTKVPPPPAAADRSQDPDEDVTDFTAPAWGAKPTPAADPLADTDDADDADDRGRASEPEPELAGTSQPDEPAAGEATPEADGSALVTVVPGVPRYHEPDCILIRFMPEKDIQKLTTPEAKSAGCTPCAACQPAG